MDKVTTVRKYIKREEWKTLIRECQTSGMTVRAWCELNGIKEQTYYRNLKKLREELVESLPAPIQKLGKPTIFQKLEVQSPLLITFSPHSPLHPTHKAVPTDIKKARKRSFYKALQA